MNTSEACLLGLHVAHIEDYRINGNNHPDNLRTLCPECHAAEGGD